MKCARHSRPDGARRSVRPRSRCPPALFLRAVLLLALVGFGRSIVSARGPASEDARSRLERAGVELSSRRFVEAVETGDLSTVQLFLRAGMDPDTVAGDGRTVLIVSTHRGRSDVAIALVNGGASVNVQDRKGFTAVMYAVLMRQRDLAEVLLAAGADPDAQNEHGVTALKMAVEANDPAMVDLLLKWHANACIRTYWGENPLDSAEKSRRAAIARRIRQAGFSRAFCSMYRRLQDYSGQNQAAAGATIDETVRRKKRETNDPEYAKLLDDPIIQDHIALRNDIHDVRGRYARIEIPGSDRILSDLKMVKAPLVVEIAGEERRVSVAESAQYLRTSAVSLVSAGVVRWRNAAARPPPGLDGFFAMAVRYTAKAACSLFVERGRVVANLDENAQNGVVMDAAVAGGTRLPFDSRKNAFKLDMAEDETVSLILGGFCVNSNLRYPSAACGWELTDWVLSTEVLRQLWKVSIRGRQNLLWELLQPAEPQ